MRSGRSLSELSFSQMTVIFSKRREQVEPGEMEVCSGE